MFFLPLVDCFPVLVVWFFALFLLFSSSSFFRRSLTSSVVRTSPTLACTRFLFLLLSSTAALFAGVIFGAIVLTMASQRSFFGDSVNWLEAGWGSWARVASLSITLAAGIDWSNGQSPVALNPDREL